LSVVVLCVSSVARERYKLLSDIKGAAKLSYSVDPNGDGNPIHRRVFDPDAVVGAGKESGEIEYAADSVSVVARVVGRSSRPPQVRAPWPALRDHAR
jgi:hypothetical protein